MKKTTKFFCVLSLIFISSGIIMCIVSFCFKANFQQLKQSFEKSKFFSYFYRNDNSDLTRDALIWEDFEANDDLFKSINITNIEKYSIKELNLSSNHCQIIIKPGDTVQLRIKNLIEENINCSISKNGVLTIRDTPSFGTSNIFTRQSYSENGIIEITLPQNISLEELNLSTKDLGSILIEENQIFTKNLSISNLNGNIFLANLTSEKSNIYSEYGEVIIYGNLLNDSKVSCDSGSIELFLDNQFSFSLNNEMGNIIVNDISYSNINKPTTENMNNNLVLSCKLGNIKITN